MQLATTTFASRSSLAALVLGTSLIIAGGAFASPESPNSGFPSSLFTTDTDDGDAIQYPGGLPILPMNPTPIGNRRAPTGLGVQILNNGGTGVAGLSFAQSSGYIPPDTQGATSPSSYVETVNQSVGLYSP